MPIARSRASRSPETAIASSASLIAAARGASGPPGSP
jgi:hypothetical protein